MAGGRRADGKRGSEIEVRLIQRVDEDDQEAEVAAALFRESPIHAWLEYVRSRLPGAESLAPDADEPAEEPVQPPTGEPRPRRRMTPPERIGRRFVNLVQKCRQSLDNPEYMRAVSLFRILAYYAVFQRITWLLLQHKVIDNGAFVRLTTDVHEGSFGPADGQPPAASPLRERHVQHIWLENWRSAEVHAHALAAMVVTEGLPIIRPVTAQNLVRLSLLLPGEAWPGWPADPAAEVLGLWAGEDLIGVAAGQVQPDGRGRLAALFVVPAWRRRYWGSCVAQALGEELCRKGACSLKVTVPARDWVLAQFWDAQGWSPEFVSYSHNSLKAG